MIIINIINNINYFILWAHVNWQIFHVKPTINGKLETILNNKYYPT